MSWPTPQGEPPGGPYYDEQPYSPYALPAGSDSPPYGAPPPYGPPPQYGQAGYGYQVQPTTTNSMAIASLVCSLCGAFVVPIIGSILGIIFGHIAKKQIRVSGEAGDGLAIAGLIVGYIFAGLYVLGCLSYIVFVVVLVGAAATTSGSYDSGSDGYSFVLPVLTSLFGG